jgi:hypothetical protein
VLAAAGHNFGLLLRWLERFVCALIRALLGMDTRRTISFPVVSMNPLDIAPELTIGDLARGSPAETAKRSSLTVTRSAHRT